MTCLLIIKKEYWKMWTNLKHWNKILVEKLLAVFSRDLCHLLCYILYKNAIEHCFCILFVCCCFLCTMVTCMHQRQTMDNKRGFFKSKQHWRWAEVDRVCFNQKYVVWIHLFFSRASFSVLVFCIMFKLFLLSSDDPILLGILFFFWKISS